MQVINGKMCPICREYKSLSEYGVRMRNGKNIGQGYCKLCKKVLDKEYVQKTRGKARTYVANKRLVEILKKSGEM